MFKPKTDSGDWKPKKVKGASIGQYEHHTAVTRSSSMTRSTSAIILKVGVFLARSEYNLSFVISRVDEGKRLHLVDRKEQEVRARCGGIRPDEGQKVHCEADAQAMSSTVLTYQFTKAKHDHRCSQ